MFDRGLAMQKFCMANPRQSSGTLSPIQFVALTAFALIPRVRSFQLRFAVGDMFPSSDLSRLMFCAQTKCCLAPSPRKSFSGQNLGFRSNVFHHRHGIRSLCHDATAWSTRRLGAANLCAIAASDITSSCIVGDADSGWGQSIGMDDNTPLPEHPGLVAGALPNGFRYSIFKNKIPANRIYANLAVHAGSVDEADNEQVDPQT